MSEIFAALAFLDFFFAIDGLLNLLLLGAFGTWLLGDDPAPEVQEMLDVNAALSA